MLDVKQNGQVAVIDMRERILKGEHPRGEILKFVEDSKRGTVIEIHVPHPVPPLVASLDAMGLNAVTNRLGEGHFRLMCVKI